MNKDGPIVVIEDDLDDQLVFSMVFNDVRYPNEIVFSQMVKPPSLSEYKRYFPFLVLSDINLPKLDGLEVRKLVHANEELSKNAFPTFLHHKCKSKKRI